MACSDPALATPELRDRIRTVGGPIGKSILDVSEFVGSTCESNWPKSADRIVEALKYLSAR